MTIRIHPQNPKLFEYRDQPLALICATEHYGAVLNRPFRFERYIHDAASRGQTLSRLFTLFRELQNQVNPYSTCKPESTDYIAPFARTGRATPTTASSASISRPGIASFSNDCTLFWN